MMIPVGKLTGLFTAVYVCVTAPLVDMESATYKGMIAVYFPPVWSAQTDLYDAVA